MAFCRPFPTSTLSIKLCLFPQLHDFLFHRHTAPTQDRRYTVLRNCSFREKSSALRSYFYAEISHPCMAAGPEKTDTRDYVLAENSALLSTPHNLDNAVHRIIEEITMRRTRAKARDYRGELTLS